MIFAAEERGHGLVEYALILVLIAIVVLLAVQLFGGTLNNTFETINNRLAEIS